MVKIIKAYLKAAREAREMNAEYKKQRQKRKAKSNDREEKRW